MEAHTVQISSESYWDKLLVRYYLWLIHLCVGVCVEYSPPGSAMFPAYVSLRVGRFDFWWNMFVFLQVIQLSQAPSGANNGHCIDL